MISNRGTTSSDGYRKRTLAITLVLFMVTMTIVPMITVAADVGDPVEEMDPVVDAIDQLAIDDEVWVNPEGNDAASPMPVVEDAGQEDVIEAVEPDPLGDSEGSPSPFGLSAGPGDGVPNEEIIKEPWMDFWYDLPEEDPLPSMTEGTVPSASLVKPRGTPGGGVPFSNPPGPYPDFWVGRTPAPGGLVRYTHVQDPGNSDSFYTFSGVDGSYSVVDTCYRYDVPTDTWNPLTAIPNPGEGTTGACDGSNVYVMGGNWAPTQLYIYNIAGDSWSSGAALPRNSIMSAAGTWGGEVFLIGGDDDFTWGGTYNQVNIYDIGTDTWTGTGTPMPTPTWTSGYYQVGSYLYIVGGWGDTFPVNIPATQRYDMATDTWSAGPAFTPAKGDFALAYSAADNSLYAIGGDADGGGAFDPTNDVWSLDLSTWPAGAWVNTGDPIPTAFTANNAGYYTDIGFDAGVWSVGGYTGAAIVGDTQYKITAPAPPYRCELTPPSQFDYGFPSTDVDYTLTVTNTGANPDAYDLSAWGNSWPVSFWDTGGGTSILVSEDFEGAFPPPGWTVVQYGSPGFIWQRSDFFDKGNQAGTGFCAAVDSDWYWPPPPDDTNSGLWTPSFSLAGATSANLDFDTYYWDIGTNDYAEVRVSTDGGGSWTQIALWTSSVGPFAHITLSLDAFVGNPNVIVEFHYDDDGWDWYWHVDNVEVTSYTPPSISATPVIPSGGTYDFIARHSIPPGANPGDLDLANIRTTSQNSGGVWSEAQITTQVPYNQIYDGFETGGLPGGTIEIYNAGGPFLTSWELGTPGGGIGPATAYKGTDCAGTNIADYYYMNADTVLTTPYVRVASPDYYLEFYNWYDIEPTGDEGGFVEISANNGPWTQIYPTGGYPVTGWMGGYSTDGYGGTSGGWVYEYYDLSAYSGNVVRSRFHFASAGWGYYPGWYVDEVYLGPPPPYDVELYPDYQHQYAHPGTNAIYPMRIENKGTSPDTFSLDASGNSWPINFYIGGPAATTEDFNAAFPPPGWTTSGLCGSSQSGYAWGTHYWWQYDDSNYPLTTSPPTCAGIWWSDGNGGDTVQDEWLMSPPMNLMGYSDYQVEFWSVYNWNSAPMGWPEFRMGMEVSTDGGATWTQIAELAQDPAYQLGGAGYGGWGWNWNEVPIVLDLTAYCGQPNVQVAWHYYCDPPGTGYAIWTVDDVTFSGTTANDPITEIGPVPPGVIVDFFAEHQVPSWASPGDYDIGTITAQSQGDPAVVDDAVIHTTVPHAAPWYDQMESGPGDWTSTGLWHQVTDGVSPYPNSYSPTTSWWYGQDATGDYDTGGTNWGRLESPPIDLGAHPNPVLRFMEWYVTEGGYPNWDQRWVQINDGSGWTDIQQLPEDQSDTWLQRQFDLTPWAGQVIQVGFLFDTVDDLFNDYRGWYVDDVYLGQPPYVMELIPPVQGQTGSTGHYVDYILTINNLGLWDDTYDLSVIAGAWPVEFWDITGSYQIWSIFVPAGGSASFIARVYIPAGLGPGSFDSTTVLATSQNDPLFTSDTAILNTNGEPEFWFGAGPATQTRWGWKGDYVDHYITITNQGTEPDCYLPMFDTFIWRVEFFEIGEEEPTWWVGPCQPGGTYTFIARVRIPNVSPGDMDAVDISITSVGDRSYMQWVEIITRTSLAQPYYNPFSSVWGQGVTVDQDFTRNNPAWAGVDNSWSYSGAWSMWTRSQGQITSCYLYMDNLDTGIVSCVVHRPAANTPDLGEDLLIEYKNDRGNWYELGRFYGGGMPGESYYPVYTLPEDALHPRFQLRFTQTAGGNNDYWYLDDLYAGSPDPDFDLQPNSVLQGSGPGYPGQYNLMIQNDAQHNDYYQVRTQGNWPAYIRYDQDNFNDGNYNGWVVVDEGTNSAPSNWYVDGSGVLVQSSNIWLDNGQNLDGTYVYYDNPGWNNYALRTDFRSTDNDGIGLMGRYTDANNYYRFQWSLDGGWDKDKSTPGRQRRVLDVCRGGSWSVLASEDVGYTQGQWYNVEMRFVDDNIQVLIDDSLIFDVQDRSLSQGTVALYSWGNQNCYFDDVMVYPPEGPYATEAVIGPVPCLGGTYDFQIYIDVPGDTVIGDYDITTVRAYSIFDPTPDDISTLRTDIYPVHNLDQDTWHPTIQSGINNANPYDHVFVYSGTYHERVVIDRPLRLEGEDRHTTIIDGSYSMDGVYFISTHTADAGWGWGWDNGRIIDNTLDWLWPTHAESGPILLLWDHDAWTNAWKDALNARSMSWTEMLPITVSPADLDPSIYSMIIMPDFMTTAGVQHMETMAAELQTYVETGGILVDMIATNYQYRWATGTSGPFGVVTNTVKSAWSYMVDPTHPMLTGMTPLAIWGNWDTHGSIPTPPAGSDTLMTTGNVPGGTPVACWLEFPGGIGYHDNVVQITSDDVTLHRFTVQNGGTGINMDRSAACQIMENIITTDNGIEVMSGYENWILGNEITAQQTFNTNSLGTMFASNNQYDGNMFDVEASKELTITGFDCNIGPGTTVAEVYYKPGTYVGSETDPSAWTLLGSTQVCGRGIDTPTYVPIGGLTLPPGQTYGLYVTVISSGVMRYTNGANVYSNSDLTITTGCGKEYPFGGTPSPRTWNGRIHYNLGDSAGGTGVHFFGPSYDNNFRDDFSTNTGGWSYVGSAMRTSDYIQLTPNSNGQVGQAWFNTPISTDFIVDFDYYIGGGSGADGMALMFYKQTGYVPAAGGYIGFVDGGGNIPGYGVEFDTYLNGGWDLNNRHIAIIQDQLDNHLTQVYDTRVRDGDWHHVRVMVANGDMILVYVDDMGSPLLSHSGTVDTTFDGFGFTAGTGGLNDYHLVDNVQVSWGLPGSNNFMGGNTITDYGYGVVNEWVDGNVIFYNDFMYNNRQAFDGGVCSWDDGYPAGGNYWSDHTSPDAFSGPLQNIPGSDNIVDNPYVLDGDSEDRYPLTDSWTTMVPGAVTYEVICTQQSGEWLVGQSGEYVITVFNTGTTHDIYDLSVISNNWDTTIWDYYGNSQINELGPVAPGGMESFRVRVTIPSDALNGVVDTSEISIVSRCDNSLVENLVFTTTAEVDMTAPEDEGIVEEPVIEEEILPEEEVIEEAEEIIEEPSIEDPVVDETVIIPDEPVEEMADEPVETATPEPSNFGWSWLLFPTFFIIVLVPTSYRLKRKRE